ncbi:Uncharacterised protein [Pseudomonas synxantha]|uniref:Uncharacterized protein n=1 Tax=Pseudomonas synxantha TaxID=47883 RepID=A0AAX3I3M1_9PSED|nr:Uncharacterised protein [Pseudomonas synxantha]
MGGLPYRVSFHIHHLESLPDPEINRPGEKRVGMQVNHLHPVRPRQRFQGTV